MLVVNGVVQSGIGIGIGGVMEIPNAKHICSSDTTWVWVNNVSLQPGTLLLLFFVLSTWVHGRDFF